MRQRDISDKHELIGSVENSENSTVLVKEHGLPAALALAFNLSMLDNVLSRKRIVQEVVTLDKDTSVIASYVTVQAT